VEAPEGSYVNNLPCFQKKKDILFNAQKRVIGATRFGGIKSLTRKTKTKLKEKTGIMDRGETKEGKRSSWGVRFTKQKKKKKEAFGNHEPFLGKRRGSRCRPFKPAERRKRPPLCRTRRPARSSAEREDPFSRRRKKKKKGPKSIAGGNVLQMTKREKRKKGRLSGGKGKVKEESAKSSSGRFPTSNREKKNTPTSGAKRGKGARGWGK